jgi:hypothetical protein
MPFEVFRRHQKKLLAVFAILAMFGFVVSDSLPKLLSPNSGSRDQPVVSLYGKTIYRSTLNEMHERRNNANIFMTEINPYYGRNQFGGVKDRDLVDALILEHEANSLGLPSGPDVGRDFLKMISQNQMTSEIFDSLVGRMNNRVSGEQLLTLIGDQVRLQKVRLLPGNPLVTPYDVFRTYRDQNELVSAKAVEIPVEKFLAKVPEPTAAQIESLYEKYKDVLPDPARETPGFKVPRQIQVEILSIDGNALARGLMDTLSEQDLRTSYENRKKEFPAKSELPVDLFAGQPELTPPILRAFEDVRAELAVKLAEDRAASQISDNFAKIKVDVLEPFYDEYGTALDELEEARKKDPKATKVLPVPAVDLKEIAQRENLNYEVTKLLSQEEADQYGPISSAQVGTVALSGGHKFAAEFFDSRKALYEPEELIDLGRTRYLARKIKDVAAHVPTTLDEVRSDVSLAFKTIEARALAEKAAAELAAQLNKKGGTIKEGIIDGYRVLTIPPISRKKSQSRIASPFGEAPEETTVPDVAYAGEAFREAYFGLQTGSVATATNEPRTVYYVMALDKRDPATFAALYAPYSDQGSYESTAKIQAARQLADEWMKWLRQKAGLANDWIPADEIKGQPAPDEA